MEKKYMSPLWLMYPWIAEGSIGWRMGYGEDYSYDFYKWFGKLSDLEKKEYNEKFPKPVMWNILKYKEFKLNDFYIRKWDTLKYNIKYVLEERKNGIEREQLSFWGHTKKEGNVGKECLSQWYMRDFKVNHLTYCCMEQYMMSEKAKLFGDKEIFKKIMNTCDQKEIKQLGRKVKGFDDNIWNEVKYHIVLTGNYYKFSQNKDLRNFLLATGDKLLVEASPYDTIWGIGMGQENKDCENPEKWKGKNLLGFALMEVREELKRLWKYEDEIDFDLKLAEK